MEDSEILDIENSGADEVPQEITCSGSVCFPLGGVVIG